MRFSIRLLYLYLFSFIGLLIGVIGSVRLVQLGIKVYVFQGADQYNFYSEPALPEDGKTPVKSQAQKDSEIKQREMETQRQREREVAEAAAMLIIGIPLYKYHWNLIQKENKQEV